MPWLVRMDLYGIREQPGAIRTLTHLIKSILKYNIVVTTSFLEAILFLYPVGEESLCELQASSQKQKSNIEFETQCAVVVEPGGRALFLVVLPLLLLHTFP